MTRNQDFLFSPSITQLRKELGLIFLNLAIAVQNKAVQIIIKPVTKITPRENKTLLTVLGSSLRLKEFKNHPSAKSVKSRDRKFSRKYQIP